MARFASIPQTVKAVFPMNKNFIRGTGVNPEIESKLEAIAQGIKTTATTKAKQDVYAMNRLQPGDDIAFYNPQGDVSFAKYQGNRQVPQEIFYPNSTDARRAYAASEGGKPIYTNPTLFGSFNPKVIPLDQPFSPPSGYMPGLPGTSQVMQFSDASPLINFATTSPNIGTAPNPLNVNRSITNPDVARELINQVTLPPIGEGLYRKVSPFEPVDASSYDSGLAGTFDRLPKQIADKVRQRKNYEEQYADTGFYKDSHVNWRASPIRNQPGASPYFQQNLADAEYSPELMAAAGYVQDSNGNYQKVKWMNTGKGGVIGEINVNGESQVIDETFGTINKYKPIFVSSNYVNYAFKNPGKYGITAPRSQYNISPTGREDSQGNSLYRLQRNDIPLQSNNVNASQMQNADQELYNVSNIIKRGGIGDIQENYYGSTSEAGYNAIQQLAKRGGSGRWVDDASESDYDFFKLNGSSSQSNQMERNDLLASGGYSPEWAGGIAFNEKGMPVDIPNYQVPPGYQNISAASELLDIAPQHRYMPRRNIQRLTEESELPSLTPLNPYFVNNYGVIEKSYITNKSPLSVQAYNDTLDNTQMANQGRWVGGGILEKGRSRTASDIDPLDSTYQIRLPNGIAFKPELERSDPRVKQAWSQQQQALQQAAQTHEESFIPYKKNYDIEYTENQIPGTNPGTIEGAYLPALVEQSPGIFEPSYHPYTPNESLLDQHLSDVKIKLGNEYYPLTREATMLQYLPSEKQAANAKSQMYGKRKIYADGRIEEFEDYQVPDDNAVASARNNLVYANPDVDGSLDIVGALDRERQQIESLSAIAEQKLPYNISRGNGIKLIDDYGSGKIDMQLLAANPMMAMHQMVGIAPKQTFQPNTLRDSVLYGRGEGQATPSGTIQTNRNSPNIDGTAIGKSTSLNRIINEEEAARIQQQMSVRPRVQKEVTTDDGTTYWEDIDSQGVYQKDLEGIVDNPNKKLSYDEVLQLLDNKESNYQTAANAYKQLMNLEPQDEIVINATTKKPGSLSDQLQQYGLATEITGNDVYGRGSLTAGLPGENIPDLPVQRFSRVEVDPEIAEMRRLSETRKIRTGLEKKQSLIPITVQYLDTNKVPKLFTQAKYDNDVKNSSWEYGNQLENMIVNRDSNLSGNRLTQTFDGREYLALPELLKPSATRNPLMGISMKRSNPGFANEINPAFSKPLIRGSYTPSPWDDPAEVELHQMQQSFNQSKQLLLTGPKNPNDYTPEQLLGLPPSSVAPDYPAYLPIQNQPHILADEYSDVLEELPENLNPIFNQPQQPQLQRNPWLKPGLIGAGVLGVGGLSQYVQQQQQQQQDDERMMRGYRI